MAQPETCRIRNGLMSTPAQSVLAELKSLANPEGAAGMARYGIKPQNAFGIAIPELRRIAGQVGKDHALAGELWESGIHEARLLACFIDDPKQVTETQMETWAADFDSWDVCDQCCSNLFDKTPYAYEKAAAWCGREAEFTKRAGFTLMAALAVHDKKAGNERFEAFFPFLLREAKDERNYVKKAVNWALRQIGKRNRRLNRRAIELAEQIAQMDSKSARWIAADALRELQGEKIQMKLRD
jgi:3-methyladenine DNA glycosylase AlkD